MKSYAFSNFLRWLLCGFCFVFSVGRLSAAGGTFEVDFKNEGTQAVTVYCSKYQESTTPYNTTSVDVPPGAIQTIIGSGIADHYVDVYFYTKGARGTLVGNSYIWDGSSATDTLPGGESVTLIINFQLPTDSPYLRSYGSLDPPFGFLLGEPGRGETPDSAKGVWRVTDETLTSSVFREGIDKVVYQVGASGGGGGGGGGTMGTNATGNSVEDVAAIQKQALGGSDSDTEFITEETSGTKVRAPKGLLSAMNLAGDAAATADITIFQAAAGGDAPVGLGYTVADGAKPSILDLEFPAAFGGATFHFDPFVEGRMATVAAWFKTATSWLVLVLLGIWVWSQLDTMGFRAASAQQAKGNTVAGSGAQITGLLAAGLITAALVILFTALLAWGFGEIGFSVFRSMAGTNPMASLPSGILWMLNQMFPVSTMITALVAKLAWKLYAVPLFMGCLAVVRFVVP